MRSNKKCLDRAKLYLILDTQVNSYKQLLDILKSSLRGGVDIVQLRDKSGNAKEIADFTKEAMTIAGRKVPFIVNDRVDLAMWTGASGVHLGQEDIPLVWARKMLGTRKIIGVSCQTLEHARRAQKDGADYIGFGSVFKTQTKPGRSPMDLELLKKVVREIKVPVFAIGGITSENIMQLRGIGVQRVAVCREICLAKNVSEITQILKQVCLKDGLHR